MFRSPLETFEIILYCPIHPLLDISLTNAVLFLSAVAATGAAAVWLGTAAPLLVPTRLQVALESLYRFLLTMVSEQTHGAALPFFPLFLLTFLLILLCNLVGLLPFAFTVTAQFAVTFALALSFNVGFLLLGLATHGFRFLRLFVPSDAPPLLVPLIVAIEVVSYSIRTFSLSIRLFANMMAGHTLLHILATFALKMAKGGLGGTALALLPFGLILAVFVLEFGIALIQAYVFAILLCIYANDAYHPGH